MELDADFRLAAPDVIAQHFLRPSRRGYRPVDQIGRHDTDIFGELLKLRDGFQMFEAVIAGAEFAVPVEFFLGIHR